MRMVVFMCVDAYMYRVYPLRIVTRVSLAIVALWLPLRILVFGCKFVPAPYLHYFSYSTATHMQACVSAWLCAQVPWLLY